jgi:Mn-dependent DtxR family transcriptional regulator
MDSSALGLFVPFTVQERDDLTSTQKLIVSQIAALKDCDKTDGELSEMLQMSSKTISNNLTRLRSLDIVSSYRDKGKRVLTSSIQHTNRGSWIPSEIIADTDLSPTEKLLLGNINSMQHCKKGCYASNFHFAKVLGVTVQRVKDILSKLRASGWVQCIKRAGKRLLSICKSLAQLPGKNTCTSRKNDGIHSNKIKRKKILPVGEKSSFSISDKIQNVIKKTDWLYREVKQTGSTPADFTSDLLKTGFQYISDNATRAFSKDRIHRIKTAQKVMQHPAADHIADRYKKYFHNSPSPDQLGRLVAAADQYTVEKVAYAINVIGINSDQTKYNASGVISFLKTKYA